MEAVEPGESGSFDFEFTPRPLVAGNNVIEKPEFKIAVSVQGIDTTGRVQTATDIKELTAVVNSDLLVNQQTLYYSGPFQNSGPYLPKVAETTTMTIGWSVTNSSNLIEGGKVTTNLPSYVEWRGVTSPNNEDISFNSVKREVTWNLGEIKKGAGFSSADRKVFFQVAITPSLSQLSQPPNLTTDVLLSGEDTFTGVLLRNSRRPHRTSLLNDIQAGSGAVQAE